MKKILCATDFSPPATAAIDEAAKLAESLGAELILYHAVAVPRDLPLTAFELTPEELETHLEEGRTAQLREAAAAISAEVEVTFRVEVHKPWQGIVAAGEETQADLIVIGSHGAAGMEKILGTTARMVVEHATRPVLVVPKRRT